MKNYVTVEEFNKVCQELFDQHLEQQRLIDISTTATPTVFDPKLSRVIQEEFWNIL